MNHYGRMAEKEYKRAFRKMEKLLLDMYSPCLFMNGNLEMLMKGVFGAACEQLGYGPFVMDKKFFAGRNKKKGASIDFLGFDRVMRQVKMSSVIPFEFKCTFASDASGSKKAAKDAAKKAVAYRMHAFPGVRPRIIHFLNTSNPSSSGPWPLLVRNKFPSAVSQMSLERLREVYRGEADFIRKGKGQFFLYKFRFIRL